MTTDVRITFDRLPTLTREIEQAIGRAIRKTTFDITSFAVLDAPVDTGNLRNSVQPTIIDSMHGRVSVNAEYGIYVNYGTYKMAAQPFFTRAVERGGENLERAVRIAIGGIR